MLPSLVTFVVLLAVFPPVFWVAGRLACRLDPPDRWLRRVLVALWAVAAVTYLALSTAGAADLGRAAVSAVWPALGGSVVGDWAAQFVVAIGAAAATLAAYAPLVPSIREVRGASLSTTTAVRQLGRYAAAFALVFSAALAVLLRLSAGDIDGPTLGLLAVGLAGLFLASPTLVRLFRETREPTEAERGRIEALRSRAGLAVDRVWVVEGDADTAEVHVRGPPGRRALFVSSFLLDAFADDTVAALLAVEAGRIEARHREVVVGPTLFAVAALLGLLLWGSTLAATLAVLLVVVLPLPVLWVARRRHRRADDYAAERVGAETLAAAFEDVAETHGVTLTRGGVGTLLRARPPLGDRLDRLETGES